MTEPCRLRRGEGYEACDNERGDPGVLFSSSIFLFKFLPVVLLGYYVVLRGHRRAQNAFLLLTSLFFYAWGSPFWMGIPIYLPLIVLSIGMNYAFGLWVWKYKRQCRYLTFPVSVAVAANLAVLFVFKYLDFTVDTINFFGAALPLPGIELPIGISFFTFQALSYVLDVAMDRTEVQRSPFALGLYIAFFPQLIAGPIVKYADVSEQIRCRQENWRDFSRGVTRFLTGLSKKVLLANQLAAVADRTFALDPETISAPLAWIGLICYALQLYYDFSGYSDMAIGLGLMFGFRFRENFDHPYAAKSFTEFWQRWHISLGAWFRDYVYFPLGGSRRGVKIQVRNMLVVWLLTGLWHGANWTYVVWGLVCFVLLFLEKYFRLGKGWPAWAMRAYTIFAILLMLVPFRSESLAYAGGFLGALAGANGGAWTGLCTLYLRENAVIGLFALLFCFPFAAWAKEKLYARRIGGRDLSLVWDLLYALGLLGVTVMSVSFLVKGTYNPFIYFNF